MELYNTEDFGTSQIGNYKFETIRGNHTQVALQELVRDGLVKNPTHLTAKFFLNLDYLTKEIEKREFTSFVSVLLASLFTPWNMKKPKTNFFDQTKRMLGQS